MNLTIDSSKLKEAAKLCPEARKVLQTLFPDIITEYHSTSDVYDKIRDKKGNLLIEVRTGGNLAYKGFYLDNYYNWEIVKDDSGIQVLRFKDARG